MRGPSLVHWFIHSFVTSFVCSFIHSFVCSFLHGFILSLGPQPQPQPNTFPHCIYWKKASRDWSDCYTLCKVSNELAYGSNASVDSLAFHHFGPEQGGISWKKSLCIKDLNCCILKRSRDWSDCCTLYNVSNQFEYGLIALLGWKRSNVLFSHCTYTDVAFIRFGLDCKQIIRFGLDCKQKSADAFKLRGC